MKLIDSSSWIHMLRRNGDATVRARVVQLLQDGEAASCPVVRLELCAGARSQRDEEILREHRMVVPELPMVDEVWELACSLAHGLRRAGWQVPLPDILVAACAEHYQVEIEHADHHFEQIAAFVASR